MKPKEVYEAYKNFKVPSLSGIRDTANQYSKTSLLIVIFLVALLLFALQYIPHLQVTQFNITNQKDLADAENSYRATLAQIFGGIAIAIGIYYTWRRITIAEEDLKATKEGQITERFTRAIDQLGSVDKDGNPAIEIRLGGIYALERIANESDKDYWPIVEILMAYVRDKLPYDEIKAKNTTYVSKIDRFFNNETKEEPDVKKVPLDIQTVLTVIGRRKYSPYSGETNILDLSKTNLSGFSLIGAHLEGANFNSTNLQEADLQRANLQGAYLQNTNLQGANLIMVSLRGATLEFASLQQATLMYANLTNANLRNANLGNVVGGKVNFVNADFGVTEDYFFDELGMGGASLERAYFSESNLKNANLKRANLKGAIFEKSYFEGANLQEANLEDANFKLVNLKGAKNLTVDQLSKTKTLYKAVLDEELEADLRAKGFGHLIDEPK
jgi:uncharacterized protein YjbI with pentapeptide repeats